MFAWDKIAHDDTGWEGEVLMMIELILPQKPRVTFIHDTHHGPTNVAQHKGQDLAVLMHSGMPLLLLCLTWALCQDSSAPQLELFLSQGVCFNHVSSCWAGDHQVYRADHQANLCAMPCEARSCSSSGEVHRMWCSNRCLETSCNFNNRFLWARPNHLWHLPEICRRKMTQCPINSALPSGVFVCEHQPCCTVGMRAWLTSYPSPVAGKSLCINSFSKDNRLPL